MKTIADRMRWVLSVKGWTEREWARRAGLKEESNVNKLIRRAESEPGRIPGDANTLASLALAAGVSLDWLSLGRGEAFSSAFVVDDDPKYPTRPGVIAGAHLMGFSRAAIDAVLAYNTPSTDPGVDFWLKLLQLRQSEFSASNAESPQLRK